jgi:hypothetical protein
VAGNVLSYCGAVFPCMTCSFNRTESAGLSLRALGVRRRGLGKNLSNILIVIFITSYTPVRVDDDKTPPNWCDAALSAVDLSH